MVNTCDSPTFCPGISYLGSLVDGYMPSSFRLPLNASLCLRGVLRLRAAVFVNAVAIRDSMSIKNGVILDDLHQRALQTATFLFASAYNSFMAYLFLTDVTC